MISNRFGCLSILLLSAAIGAAVNAGMGASMRQMRPVSKRAVPADFPVVIVTTQGKPNGPCRAAILRNDQIAEYVREQDDWSFTVPIAHLRELQAQLRSQTSYDGGVVSGAVAVLRSAGREQLVQVSGSWSGEKGTILLTSVYTASGKRFTAKSASIDNPGMRASAGILAASVSCILLWMTRLLLRDIARRIRARERK